MTTYIQIEEIENMKNAKKFLAELLDETICWSNTDKQHQLSKELKLILGEYCPDWIKEE